MYILEIILLIKTYFYRSVRNTASHYIIFVNTETWKRKWTVKFAYSYLNQGLQIRAKIFTPLPQRKQKVYGNAVNQQNIYKSVLTLNFNNRKISKQHLGKLYRK